MSNNSEKKHRTTNLIELIKKQDFSVFKPLHSKPFTPNGVDKIVHSNKEEIF